MDELKKFETYMAHLSEGLGHADRHAGLRGYCSGLLSPLARKSVEPMAALLDPLFDHQLAPAYRLPCSLASCLNALAASKKCN